MPEQRRLLEDGNNACGGQKSQKQQQQQQQKNKKKKENEPVYDVFLGGSCGNTCWRSDIVIPYLKKHAISYYDPQRPVWSENLIREEQRAKENSKIFLFVLDPGTINATSFLEIAYFASRKASKLVVVFLGRHEWSDKALKVDLPDRIRTCNLLEAILKRHSVLMLTSIHEALDFVDEKIIRGKPWTEALANPQQRLPFLKLNARRCLDTCSVGWLKAKRFCRTRLFTHLSRLLLLLAFEAFLLLLFKFVLSPLLLSPLGGGIVSIWVLVLPLLAFNYLLLLSLIIYCRFKNHRKKRQVQRSLLLPMPPLPRVCTMGESLELHHQQQQQNQQQQQIRKNNKNPPRVGNAHTSSLSSSQSLNSLSSGNCRTGNGYEPMIELLISGSTNPKNVNRPIAQGRRPSTINNRNRQKSRISPVEKSEKLRQNGCLTSPIGYDVFLSCSSSSELEWITQKAVPELHKNGLSYTSALMCDGHMRIPFLHTASHILYYIPSYKTFLSGMIEIAYFIGHSDWQVTVCVPREAECLVLLDDAATKLDADIYAAVERRNECYRMAFSYLKDMAARRQVRVFTRVEDAVRHIREKCTEEMDEVAERHFAAFKHEKQRGNDSGNIGERRLFYQHREDEEEEGEKEQNQEWRQIREEGKEEDQKQEQQQREEEEEEGKLLFTQKKFSASSPTSAPNSGASSPKVRRTALRQILEKQHLVKERTCQNLLAHLREAAARGRHLDLDLSEIRPECKGITWTAPSGGENGLLNS